MKIKEKVLKNVEKSYLKIRGWKDWEEFDKIQESSELDKNAREELILTTFKETLAEVGKVIDEQIKQEKDCWKGDEYPEQVGEHQIIIDGLIVLKQKLGIK